MMEVLFRNCAGLDVHKQFVTVTVRLIDGQGKLAIQRRRFNTVLAELQALAAWLVSLGVTHVAMESTGVYWKPIYNVLAEHCEVWVVNARHLQQVPGRKTDVTDADWIAQLMQYGLLERSFVPGEEQRDLRDLTRYRTRLTGERSSASNRLHKILEDANIKLTSVVSDVRGKSARAMLQALIAGVEDPARLAQLAKARLRDKIPALEAALQGRVREHHRYMLREVLMHIDELNQRIEALDSRLRELTRPQAATIERLATIPGVDRRTAEVILAEIGSDIKAFPSVKHLASWACLCPGNNITGGKRRSGKTRKGQNWLRPALVEAAWAAARTKTYLGAQYWRLRSRRGEKRAAVAVAHSIITIIYHLLANPEAVFTDLGNDFFLKRDVEQEKRRSIRKLEALGFSVALTPVAVPA
jgi:transposase